MLDPVEPHITRRGRFKPEIGRDATVDLPGERVRVKVASLFEHTVDAFVGKVLSTPTEKVHHGVRKDSLIVCRRTINRDLGVEIWEMVSEREMEEASKIARFKQDEEDKAAAAQRAEAEAAESGDEVTRVTKVLGPRRSKVSRGK